MNPHAVSLRNCGAGLLAAVQMGKEAKIPVFKRCRRFRFSYFIIPAVINGEVASSSLIRDIKQ